MEGRTRLAWRDSRKGTLATRGGSETADADAPHPNLPPQGGRNLGLTPGSRRPYCQAHFPLPRARGGVRVGANSVSLARF